MKSLGETGKVNSSVNKEKYAGYSGIYFSFLVVSVLVANIICSFVIKFLCVSDENLKNFQNSDVYKYISYSLASFVILIVTLIFELLHKTEIKFFCTVKLVKPKYYILALLAIFAAFFGLSGLNEYFINFLTKYFGYDYTAMTLPELNLSNFILVVLTVCVLPAFFEELAFRGVLLHGLRGTNEILIALIGGICFSLFHMNPAQTPYQFAVGFIFSLLAVTSNSIFPSVIAHFLNNFIIICVTYFCGGGFNFPFWLEIMLTVIGLVALASFIVISVLDLDKNKTSKRPKSKNIILDFSIYAMFGIIICVVMWVAGLL